MEIEIVASTRPNVDSVAHLIGKRYQAKHVPEDGEFVIKDEPSFGGQICLDASEVRVVKR